jgi:DNA-directed RNA polymerase specialized sigma24 family protein
VPKDVNMRHEADFAAYLAARWPAIVRTLVFLGQAQQEAEAVARGALANCYLDWDRVRESDDIEVEVYRAVLDRLRHADTGLPPSYSSAPESLQLAADDSDAVAFRLTLQAALARLAPDDRVVVVLRYAAGLLEPQVAEVLDEPEHVVEQRLASALSALDLERLWEATR